MSADCLTQENVICERSVLCRQTTFVFLLSRKDYASVIHSYRQQLQQKWKAFMAPIPIVKALPVHLAQEMPGLMYE